MARFAFFAVIRNPLAVLLYWHSVDLPVSRGLPARSRARRASDARGDCMERQLAILDWFCDRFARSLPPEWILRYEALVATGGRALGITVSWRAL